MKKTDLTIAVVMALCIGEHPVKEIIKSTQENAKLLENILINSTFLISCTNKQIFYQNEIIASTIDNVTVMNDCVFNSSYDNADKKICHEISKILDLAQEEGYTNLVIVIDEHNPNDIITLLGKIIGCKDTPHIKSGQIIVFEPDVHQVSILNKSKVQSTNF